MNTGATMPWPSGAEFGAWVGAAAIAAGAAWKLRMRGSVDSVEITANKAHAGWITTLVTEKDDALRREREISALYVKTSELLALSEAKNAMLMERLSRFDKEMERMKRLLIAARPDFKELLSSDFGDLIDRETL